MSYVNYMQDNNIFRIFYFLQDFSEPLCVLYTVKRDNTEGGPSTVEEFKPVLRRQAQEQTHAHTQHPVHCGFQNEIKNKKKSLHDI